MALKDETLYRSFKREPIRRESFVRSIPTKRLVEILLNDGQNMSHTKDYGDHLEEIRKEMHKRQTKQAERAAKKLEAQANDYHLRLIQEGLTCAKCRLHADFDQIDAHFYRKGKKHYKTVCKTCAKEEVKHRRALAQIVTPF